MDWIQLKKWCIQIKSDLTWAIGRTGRRVMRNHLLSRIIKRNSGWRMFSASFQGFLQVLETNGRQFLLLLALQLHVLLVLLAKLHLSSYIKLNLSPIFVLSRLYESTPIKENKWTRKENLFYIEQVWMWLWTVNSWFYLLILRKKQSN